MWAVVALADRARVPSARNCAKIRLSASSRNNTACSSSM